MNDSFAYVLLADYGSEGMRFHGVFEKPEMAALAAHKKGNSATQYRIVEAALNCWIDNENLSVLFV